MALWPPNLDDIVRCIHRILGNSEACDSFPVSVQNALSLDTYKENYLLFNSLGLCVLAGTIVWSDPVELEDVKEIAFTVQRNAGHCGLSVIASLETSPDNINWDSLAYAGFTNCVFDDLVGYIPTGLTPAQATLPITTGPKYIRGRIENESYTDITIKSWLVLTKTC